MRSLLLNPLIKESMGSRYERYYIRSGSRWPHSGIKVKGGLPHYLPFPFSLSYAAALLNANGFEVSLIDSVAADIDEDGLLDMVRDIKPELVFYEPSILTAGYDLELASKIKRLNSKSYISFGGPYATFFGQKLIDNNAAVDFIIKGEFEFSLLDIAKHIRDNSNLNTGIIYRCKDKIVDLGEPLLIEDLDRLPAPMRNIFPINRKPNPGVYWDGFCQNYPAYQLQTSRGCSYSCYFCLFNQVVYREGGHRRFSTKRVLAEIDTVQREYGAREVYFDDDDFTVDREAVFNLCSEINNRGLKIPWSCMADAINTDEEMIKVMAESGCIGIKFGVESGSRRILKKIGKPLSLKKVNNLVNLCRDYGIKSHAAFLFGLLDEKDKDLMDSINYIKQLKSDSVQISVATPYPGTRFYAALKNRGLLSNKNRKYYDGRTSDKIELVRLKKRVLLLWFIGKWCSLELIAHNLFIFYRTLRGLGVKIFITKLKAVILDEMKNR